MFRTAFEVEHVRAVISVYATCYINLAAGWSCMSGSLATDLKHAARSLRRDVLARYSYLQHFVK